jgi:signal transduction histidine kinase
MAKFPQITTTTSPVAYRDGDTHIASTPQRIQKPAHAPAIRRSKAEAQNHIIWQMTHELRVPLTAMMGFAQLLLDPKSSQPLDPQQRHYVDHILDAGEHLLSVINAMLDVAAMQSGYLQIQRTLVAPHTLLTEVRDQLASLAQEKQQRVTIRTSDALPPVNVDHLRMRQVLLNLLGNAIKFATPSSEIVLGAQPGEDGATDFYVQNHGSVIPRAYQRMIFEPFAQAPSSQGASDAPSSAGLGLAIAQQLMRLHGGTIWVRSSQRHGTIFWVHLPR